MREQSGQAHFNTPASHSRGLSTLRAAAISQSGKISLLRRAHPARRAFYIIGNLSKFPII